MTASAQTSTPTGSSGESVINGVDKLPSAAPATLVVTDENQYTDDDPAHVFFLYNVGLGKFLGNGGFYGTAAAMGTTPKPFFIYDNSVSDKGNCYNIRCKQRTSDTKSTDPLSSHDYLKYFNHDKVQSSKAPNLGNGFYLDRVYNETYTYSGDKSSASGGWYFTPATTSDWRSGYNLTLQNAYLEKSSTKSSTIYLVGREFDPSKPNDATCYDLDENSYDTYIGSLGRTDIKDNSVWRLISLAEYQGLYNQSPATLEAPIDASFLLMDQGFMMNNVEYLNRWNTTTNTDFKVGLDRLYLSSTNPGSNPSYTFDNTNGYTSETYQFYNGKYSCAKITGKNGQLYQTVAVNKNGWYTFGCNGVSSTGAKIFACIQKSKTDITANGVTVDKNIDNASYGGDDDMLAAGKDFLENNSHYNSLMIYVTGASSENPVYLRFGITTGNGGVASAKAGPMKVGEASSTDGTTIVDNFKMYYAGNSTTPDLVLDEDNEDLAYLTGTTDTYTNATLHLRRAFTANAWNTIILPVSLSKNQLQTAFGDGMMLAKLNELTDKSIRFLTVDDNNSNGYMLEAYTPYIIKPSNAGPGTTQAYSTKLHDASGEWTGAYKGKSGSSSTDGTTISVPENHYVIDRVTFNRDGVGSNVITSTWETKTIIAATHEGNSITCKGTLAKTYSDDKKILGVRDDLEGDYFFKNGAIYQVPSGKSYGLKAFRCWFEPSKMSTAKAVTVFIDNEEQTTTAVENILADLQNNESWWAKGVYNLQGQRLREGSDTQGLPQGLYIVNGKKTMIR